MSNKKKKNPYTYEELSRLFTSDGLTARIALSLLMQVGADQAKYASVVEATRNGHPLISEPMMKDIEEATGRLADTPQPIILAVIQRVLPPVTDKDMLPPLPEEDKEDVCPVCGAELPNATPGKAHFWTCPECGSTGLASYGKRFIGHTNVLDADGMSAR